MKERRRLQRFLDLKPGELISSCSGYNARIVSKEFGWYPVVLPAAHTAWDEFGPLNEKGTWHARISIELIDDTNRYHFVDGAGCVAEPETCEQILAYIKRWADNPTDEIVKGTFTYECIMHSRMLMDRLALGLPVITEVGERHPDMIEVDELWYTEFRKEIEEELKTVNNDN